MIKPFPLLCCLAALALCQGLARAGKVYLRNDLGSDTQIVVKHDKETILQARLRRGDAVLVQIDETRAKKPVLLFTYSPTGYQGRGPRLVAWPLPKKTKTLFFNLSSFAGRR